MTKMVPNVLNLVCLSIYLSLFQPWARADMFTGIAEMESLLEIHNKIIEDLDDYIMKEEKRIAELKAHLQTYKVEQELQAMEDTSNYLGNPINSFTLMKRLTIGRDFIDTSMKLGTESIQNITINPEHVQFPTLRDLAGAAQALTFLQSTYQLDVQEIVEGKLNGVAYSHPMSAEDCFEVAKTLYTITDFNNSLAWSIVTLHRHREEPNKEQSFTEVELLEYIAFTYYLLDDLKSALEWTKILLNLDPTHQRAATNVPHYEAGLATRENKIKGRGDHGWDFYETENEEVLTEPKRIKTEEMPESEEMKIKYDVVKAKYEALCRGNMDIQRDVAKRLFCRYMWETHPFLRLAPIKAEQVYIDPDVFVFHGVLSDDEIQVIKVLSTPLLQRTMFYDPITGRLKVAYYRMSKAAWLHDRSSEVVARVSQRVADMTGLSMTSAEALQVINYGIGGFYEPHYDFAANTDDIFADPDGNRIATVLFYMSDVAQGGATVFTELGLAVFPERGAALYWRNLHPSGEGDTDTRHGACPVLRGFKWVCNKWLHEAGQELIKPAILNTNE